MKLSDLKTGHIVQYRDGRFRIVLKDSVFGDDGLYINGYIGARLNMFTDDLFVKEEENEEQKHKNDDRDIKKVYKPKQHTSFKLLFDSLIVNSQEEFTNFIKNHLILIWEREEERKEITISEIEEQLGFKIKIVNDKVK